MRKVSRCETYSCTLYLNLIYNYKLSVVLLSGITFKLYLFLGEELSSVPPSPNDVGKLSKDSSIKEAENTANNEDYLEQNGVRIPSESPSAEGESSNIHINNDSTSNSTKSRPDSRRSSSVLVTQDSSPLKATRRTASDASTNKKLQEYHKWKVAGCKGDPPAKLKISP